MSSRAVRGLILSRLDYCNGLLTSVPVSHLKRLKSLQNWAARLIYRTNRRQDSSPLNQSLHWLPISKRVRYKLLLLVYKTFHNQSPQYMQTCILHHVPSRPNLRSSSDPFRLTFRKFIKTHLFNYVINIFSVRIILFQFVLLFIYNTCKRCDLVY